MGMLPFSPRKASGPRLPLIFTRMRWFQSPRQGRRRCPHRGGWKLLEVCECEASKTLLQLSSAALDSAPVARFGC